MQHKKKQQTPQQQRALSDKDRDSVRHKMLTNYNSPAERRPEHELCEERRKSAVQVLFSAQAFLVVFFFFSIRLQLLRSRMKFPAAVTSTTSSWQENLNFWKDGLQLRDFRFIYRRYLDAGGENRSSDKSTWWVNSWHCSLTANRFWCRSFSLWSSVFWLGCSSL